MSYSMRRKNVGKHTRREVIFYHRQAENEEVGKRGEEYLAPCS